MITIPEQIWFVLGVGRADELSYMCPYEVKKDGTPLASTIKMMETGTAWARGYTQWVKGPNGENVKVEKPEPEFKTLPNEPTTGIYIGSSVERYTTSNKLFRVKDPRGFTVEVPTDNIATLLHNSTVVNGYIQEPCVWARDGGHILLPVDSTPYKAAHEVLESVRTENLVSVTTLNYGDRVMLHNGGNNSGPYEFMGRAKITYEVYWKQTERSRYSGFRHEQLDKVTNHPVETITDDKWVTVFYNSMYGNGKRYYDLEQAPKIVSASPGEPSHQLTIDTLNEKHYYNLPERMKKRLQTQSQGKRFDYHDQWELMVTVVGLELKP